LRELAEVNKELEELQTHIAFQEHTIAELSEALIAQQKQLDVFRIELRLLREKLGDVEQSVGSKPFSAADEKPPHY
jgi:SlyX protein